VVFIAVGLKPSADGVGLFSRGLADVIGMAIPFININIQVFQWLTNSACIVNLHVSRRLAHCSRTGLVGRLAQYANYRQSFYGVQLKLVSGPEPIQFIASNSRFSADYGLSLVDVGLVILVGCILAKLAEMGLGLLFGRGIMA
jgi:hypothetical protein